MSRLTVTDPGYRGRVLVVHEGVAAANLSELLSIYRGLGYPPACLHVEAEPLEGAA